MQTKSKKLISIYPEEVSSFSAEDLKKIHSHNEALLREKRKMLAEETDKLRRKIETFQKRKMRTVRLDAKLFSLNQGIINLDKFFGGNDSHE